MNKSNFQRTMANVNKEISIRDLINDKSIKDQLQIKADTTQTLFD